MPNEPLNKEQLDSLAEVCNITFGAAANKLSVLLNGQTKIAKPQISNCDQDAVNELLQEKRFIIKYQSADALAVNWAFFLDANSGINLASKLLNKKIELTDDTAQKEARQAIQGLMQQLIDVALTAMNSTLGKNVSFKPPEINFGDLESRIFNLQSEYPDGALQIKFVFKIQDLIDSNLYLILNSPFAKDAADTFFQVTTMQMANMDTTAKTISTRELNETEKLNDVLAYCKKIGDFSLIENLKAPIKVRITRRKMRFGELWLTGIGSVLNFKKKIDEPVEVLFGNRVMAQAEVVAIKEKFGVKITEVKHE